MLVIFVSVNSIPLVALLSKIYIQIILFCNLVTIKYTHEVYIGRIQLQLSTIPGSMEDPFSHAELVQN